MKNKLFKRLQASVSTREDKLLLLYAIVVFFSGAIRKWFVESSALANGVLLLQMVIPFLLFALRSPKTQSPFVKFPILRIYFFYLIFHIVYPMQATIFHGMLGVLIYGPFWIGLFYYLSNREQFFTPKLIPFFLVFTAVEIVLGFIQYQLPTDHFLNKYATEAVQNIAVVGDSVRITGTFSYISGFGAFMIFYPLLIWALIRLNYSLWFVSIAIGLGLVAAFMTGSRATVLVFVGFMGVIMYSLYSIRDIGSIVGRLLIPVILGVTIVMNIGDNPVKTRINKSYENFMQRFERGIETGEQNRRILWDFTYFRDLDRFPNLITGIGLGSTYQGAIILFGPSRYARGFGYVEGEFPKIILEGGLVYFFLKLILATIATFHFSFRQPVLRLLVWFSMVYLIPIVFNVHNAAFLLMGLILIDNIFWRQAQPTADADPDPTESQKLPDAPYPRQYGYPQVGDKIPQTI